MALGATRWQLVYRVLLPAARNGLLAAVLLGVGRAVGETMAVLMATGHAVHIPRSLLRLGPHPHGDHRRRAGRGAGGLRPLPGVVPDGILLFLITFVVNLTADLVVNGIRRK